MKNLEIKVKIEMMGDIEEKLRGFGEPTLLEQKDTYFLLGERRLKIREQKSSQEIIYYIRQNISTSKESRYFRIGLSKDWTSIIKRALSIFLGEKVVVDKKRYLFIYKSTRIHLDSVYSCGNYLELETVFNDDRAEYDYIGEHKEVITKLGLLQYRSIPHSYSDILISQKVQNI